jgi:Tol biopolymer transport system component
MSVDPIGSLWLRPLDSMEWRELSGTEGARAPFWSPDSDEIGYIADGRLKKVTLAGGPSQTIADGASGDMSWGADGTLLFVCNDGDQIHSVPASGGESVLVIEASKLADTNRRHPHFLPDGRHFLYTDRDTAPKLAGIYVGSLNGETPRRLLPDLSRAVCVPREPRAETGFLLFVREGTLMAQPFDPVRLELSAGPIALSAVQFRANSDLYPFSASLSGALTLSGSGTEGYRRLVWVDRAGTVVERTDVVETFLGHQRLSPDSGHVAYGATQGTGRDVWIFDLDRETRALLSNKLLRNWVPVWSPDGAQVAFQSNRPATRADIQVRPADASEPPADLLSTEAPKVPQGWSHDGRFILHITGHAETGIDIWYLERTKAGDDWEPRVFLNAPAEETLPRLSPNGRYVAYVSTESGRREIYVRPFPNGGRRTTVSTAGGNQPVWSRDGSKLFYIDPDNTLMAADVSTAGEFTSSGVTRLFQHAPLRGNSRQSQDYDISLDGQRFLLRETVDADGEAVAAAESTIRVITNWPAKYAVEQ